MMKIAFLITYILLTISLSGQSEKFEYSDRFGNTIYVDTTDIPKELKSFFTQQTFEWEDRSEGCSVYKMEVVEIRRIRKNKYYRLRFLSYCTLTEGGATMTGGLNYKIEVEKNDKDNYRIVSKEFLNMEI